MRPRFVIGIFVFALAVIALLFWLCPKPPVTSTPAPVQSAQSPVLRTNRQPAIVARPSANPVTAFNPVTASNNTVEAQELRMQQAVEKQNVPVCFYGKVVDQDSNALAGVRVKLGVRHNIYVIPNSPEAAKYAALSHEELQKMLNPTTTVVTDTNGRCQWVSPSITGDILGVGSLTKAGYEAEPGQYSCGAGGGSYDNPVIFKMWSDSIHDKLITGSKSFPIVPDGRPYFINLTDDIISESGPGDLKVWIQYTNQVVQGQLYDWSAGIEVINGGLLEVPQAAINSGFLAEPPFAMYSAPENGYTPSFQLKSQINGGQSGEIGNRFFYLRLKDGKEYGRMSINLFAPYGHLYPGLVRISYAINPSGSHILK